MIKQQLKIQALDFHLDIGFNDETKRNQSEKLGENLVY
jgi:hypothetical protein